MQIVVLDACALIAYMRNEKGALLVKRHIDDPQNKLIIHGVNFYEVYYDSLKQQPALANLLLEFAAHINLDVYERLDLSLMQEGAFLKMKYKMSLADSIALGLAVKLNATLLTSDRHELEEIAQKKLVKIKFIR